MNNGTLLPRRRYVQHYRHTALLVAVCTLYWRVATLSIARWALELEHSVWDSGSLVIPPCAELVRAKSARLDGTVVDGTAAKSSSDRINASSNA